MTGEATAPFKFTSADRRDEFIEQLMIRCKRSFLVLADRIAEDDPRLARGIANARNLFGVIAPIKK